VLPVVRSRYHVALDEELFRRHVREHDIGHVSVVPAPVDIDRLRLVGEMQVFIDGEKLQWLRILDSQLTDPRFRFG
jgi:hypothetical protein